MYITFLPIFYGLKPLKIVLFYRTSFTKFWNMLQSSPLLNGYIMDYINEIQLGLYFSRVILCLRSFCFIGAGCCTVVVSKCPVAFNI
jgi:hypothetical protein